MYESISEVPFIASTTGEGGLGRLFDTRRSREKIRESARLKLGMPSLGSISFGRKGCARIEAAMLLPYTRIIGTTPSAATTFLGDLEKHGVVDAFTSKIALAPHVLDYLRKWKEAVGSGTGSLAASVNRALVQLTATDEEVRAFAETQRELWQDFSRSETQLLRLPGQLVRIEGDEAVVSVWNEEASRNELRSLDAAQVRDVGVESEGDALIVYETEYIAGIRVSTVVPAVMWDQDSARDAEQDRELTEYETPLPTVDMLKAEAREKNVTESDNAQTIADTGRYYRNA